MKKIKFFKIVKGLGLTFSAIVFTTMSAFAQDGVEDIAENVVQSSANLPGLVSALSYLFGFILAVSGILKIKEYIENEKQTPISTGVVRLFVAGMLFSLPFLLDIVKNTIEGNNGTAVFDSSDIVNDMNSLIGTFNAAINLGTNFNALLVNIAAFSDEIPFFVGALAYLLGLLLAVTGIIKIREHVEDPTRTSLKEPVIRLCIAGALFALPDVFQALYTTISDTGMGAWGLTLSLLNTWNFINASQVGPLAPQCAAAAFGLGSTFGDVICNSWLSASGLPGFLTAISYVVGLALGVWGIMKIRDHVLNPSQTKVSEGVTRLLAAGAFFSMPVIAIALQSTMTPLPLRTAGLLGANSTFNETPGACGVTNSLDEAFVCFMNDVLGPAQVSLNFFAFVAGLIFVMIGISRLIKSAQEGARGPGGIGTIATFVAAGFLMSGTTMVQAMSATLFGSPRSSTFAALTYAAGMTAAETAAAYNVISAILKFMIMIGLFSFIRGIFIMRDAAEGKQQASIMSGITHILAGALAVNLGPLLNALQATLGITAFGVVFG